MRVSDWPEPVIEVGGAGNARSPVPAPLPGCPAETGWPGHRGGGAALPARGPLRHNTARTSGRAGPSRRPPPASARLRPAPPCRPRSAAQGRAVPDREGRSNAPQRQHASAADNGAARRPPRRRTASSAGNTAGDLWPGSTDSIAVARAAARCVPSHATGTRRVGALRHASPELRGGAPVSVPAASVETDCPLSKVSRRSVPSRHLGVGIGIAYPEHLGGKPLWRHAGGDANPRQPAAEQLIGKPLGALRPQRRAT